MNSSPLKLRQRGTPVDSRHLGEMMAMFPPAPVQPGGVANYPSPTPDGPSHGRVRFRP